MTSIKKNNRFEMLMMGALDGELNKDDQKEFEHLLSLNPNYQKEYEKYKRLKEVTLEMKLKSPPSEVWENYWVNVYNRFERGIAWLIFSIGSMIILTYFGFRWIESILADSHVVLIVKIGILLIVGGLAILFVSVLREKLFMRKGDPYKEIQR